MSSATPSADVILIRNMAVDMSVGIHDFEKAKKQRVIINVSISVPANQSAGQDDIETVLSYADIVSAIETIAGEKHINLVETFAEKIAQHVLTHSQAKDVRVRIEKPDIFPHIDGVGIEIFRSR